MPKNEQLPGMPEVPRIKEHDDLAEDYQKEKEKRCRQTPKEVAAKTKLIDCIHKHSDKLPRTESGAVVYQNDDLTVTLAPGKEQLKVRNRDGESDGDGDSE